MRIHEPGVDSSTPTPDSSDEGLAYLDASQLDPGIQ